MAEKFIRINVAFKPSLEIAERVAKLSEEISKKEVAYFIINSKNIYPHITIYSPEYPTHNLEKILSNIEELSKNLSTVKFMFKKVITSQGYIGIEFNYTEEIKTIHEAIVKKLNDFREDHVREKYADLYNMEFSDEKKQNIQRYGYPNSMSLYHPHLTIIRLKDEKIAKMVAEEIQWLDKEFMIDEIGAYEMGEHGTCIELIKEFKLG
ncbi:MAG: 2'-5' RNA ligase family protein [Parcubacteria group bacterium]